MIFECFKPKKFKTDENRPKNAEINGVLYTHRQTNRKLLEITVLKVLRAIKIKKILKFVKKGKNSFKKGII